MSIHVICVGSELLEGRSVNTNLAFIGSRLREFGISVDAEVTIPDVPEVIHKELLAATAAADVVITVGGLGPTRDDLTKETVAKTLGLGLELDQVLLEKIKGKFRKRRRQVAAASMEKQATVPEGAVVLANDWGIAPGLWIEGNGARVCMLPGPPRELHPIFDNHVLPRIREACNVSVISRTLRVIGVGESTVAGQVDPIVDSFPGVDVGYCVKPGAIDITLLLPPDDETSYDAIKDRLVVCFGEQLGTPDENQITRICDMLRKRGGSWGTAESCTGGWIAKRVTDYPGVSDVFEGGVISYSNRLKVKLLGVSEQTLEAYGAVSEPTAREMVQGLVQRYDLTAGIAVTGIAGPDGGTSEKPIGTVFIGTAVDGNVLVTEHHFPFDRRGMRERTIIEALNQLWRQMMAEDLTDRA